MGENSKMGLGLRYLGPVLEPLKNYTKFSKLWIDNFVFRLHCKLSVLILFGSCIIVTMGQVFGDPIDCIVDNEIPDGVMDTYCWIHSTFTIPKLIPQDPNQLHPVYPHPGVGPVPQQSYEEEVVTHKFYQWVAFTLLFQGLCFLLPYQLWKYLEHGKLASIITINDLKHSVTDARMPWFPKEYNYLDTKKTNVAVAKMKDYFLVKTSFHKKSNYFLSFIICEVLNFLNVILQIVFLDVFFQGVFSTFGADVLSMSQNDPEERDDPLNRIFPKVTKCSFNKYGPSGTVEIYDGLCILSLNIINEKIYILLWFWFVLLSTISAIQLVWRVLSLMSARTRAFMLRNQSNFLALQDDINYCCAKLSHGDWFVMMKIGENIDAHLFARLIKEVARGIKKIDSHQEGLSLTEL